jgi:O-antigen ligase
MLKYGMRSLKIVLLVAFVVFIFGTFALQEETIEYLARSFDLSEANEANANAFQRLQLTFGLLRLALDHLWFGLGPGMIQKASVGALVSYDVKFEGLAGMENHFLGIFADTGIVGLSVYLLFMIQWFLSLRRGSASLPNEIDTYRSLLFIVLLFFFLGSFTVSNVVSVPMIFLFISYGLYVGKVKRLSTLHDMKLRENHTEGSPRLA